MHLRRRVAARPGARSCGSDRGAPALALGRRRQSSPGRRMVACQRERGCCARRSVHARGARILAGPRASGGSIAMQSTGQGGRQSSQPVQCSARTVCISFAAPTIASTGQAWMHSVQPMQRDSSMRAKANGLAARRSGSGGNAVTPSRRASAAIVVSPPGGQRLIGASPRRSLPRRDGSRR